MYRFLFNLRVLVLFVLVALLPRISDAQEVAFGLGQTEFGAGGRDGAVVDVEYRHTPFLTRGKFSLALGAVASLSEHGDAFVGGGLWSRLSWPSGWFADLSLMPGLYHKGNSENDLGSVIEFRSLLAVGYAFDSTRSVSVGISHMSNADLASDNPGVDAYILRYHVKF